MLKNLFKPTKAKVITDIVLAFFWIMLFYSISSLGFQKSFSNLSLMLTAVSILISLLLSLIIYYPLTCGLVFIYKQIIKANEKETPTKLDFVVAILIILIFNPFTPGFIYSSIINYNNNVINHPCGVKITGFSDTSPARDAGISVGDIIISADENKIDTIDSFMYIMANKKVGDSILLKTNNRAEYNIIAVSGANGAVLGIKIKKSYCKR